MNRLLYISTARQAFTDAELTQLLAISRVNNQAVGVTGLLVAGGRRFLQVLEGEDAAVAATFARIRRDPRHFATVVLSDQTVDTRAFGGWAMAYEQGGAAADRGDVRAQVAALVGPIADPNLRAYFEGFVTRKAA